MHLSVRLIRKAYTILMKIKFLILFICWILAFWQILPDLFNTWFDHSDNSHGILVPFIFLYLVWQQREILQNVEIKENYLGIILLGTSLAIYLVSYIGDVAFVARLMMVFSFIGVILLNMGSAFLREIRFPLLFLLFMVPVPTSLLAAVSLPLQSFATTVSAEIVSMTTIPVFQEGNMLYFANTQLEVAEACSGIRSVVSLTMLASLIAYLSHDSLRKRAILIFSAIPIAIFINIVRVVGTAILAHFFGSAVARGFLHEVSGIVVFILGLGLLAVESFLINKKINW